MTSFKLFQYGWILVRPTGLTLTLTLAYAEIQLSNDFFQLFKDSWILVAVAATRLHIGCADMSLRRNPAN